jgi:hypothetical protein
MQSTTDKNRKPAGFTMIPNALIDNPNLCVRNKMVLIKLARHCYRKTSTFVSQQKIAKDLHIDRGTAGTALESLTALGVIQPHGMGRSGKSETYTIDLNFAANLRKNPAPHLLENPALTCGTIQHEPAEPSSTNQDIRIRPMNKKAAESEVPSTAVAHVEPEALGYGKESDSVMIILQDEGPAGLFSRFDFETEEAA